LAERQAMIGREQARCSELAQGKPGDRGIIERIRVRPNGAYLPSFWC
jgi:hypothetical protein